MSLSFSMHMDGQESAVRTLRGIARNAADLRPAFDEMIDLFSTWNKDQFRTKGFGYGNERWAPLSPLYSDWKDRTYGLLPLMMRTGDLRKSLQIRSAPGHVEKINEHGFVAGTSIEYARYHQDGTPKMPQRRLIGPLSPEQLDALAKIAHVHVRKQEGRA